MSYVTTLDVAGLTPREYRAVLDHMGVETRPDPQIYLHVTHPLDNGFRIIELWDTKAGFESFLERRLGPATQALGIERQTTITVLPIHNLFAPRLGELPGLIASLPGAPGGRGSRE